MQQKTTWLKFRHKVITFLLRPVFGAVCKIKYGITIEKHKDPAKRQYLVLMNHQTAFDQFFLSLAFPNPVYYLASEDLFSLGLLSTLLRWAVAPIPIQKQTADIGAIKTCIRVAREGGTIALAPEGNRTYAGRPVHMNASIAKLAKKLALPVALMRIEGGYGIQPRWSDVVRKGKMRAFVSRVIEPEEMAAMTDEELFSAIHSELNVCEDTVNGEFRSKHMAEYIERAMYVCPKCGLTKFFSQGDTTTCRTCGMEIRHLPTKELDGEGFPFRFAADWYQHQCDFVNSLDTRQYLDTPLFEDTAQLWEIFVSKGRTKLTDSSAIKLYGDRITVDGVDYPFEELSAVTVLGKNKVNLYFGKKLYQFKGDAHFNGLKYVNIYNRHKNIMKGNEHDKFLGL